MRDKRQAVLSWLVVVMVVVVLIFPVWALIKYLRLPPEQPALLDAAASASLSDLATPPAPVEPLPSATSIVLATAQVEVTPAPAQERVYTPAAPAVTAAAAIADLPLDSSPAAEAGVPAVDVVAPYRLQVGSPGYLPAFQHADQGCQWLGAAGQAFDSSGASRGGLVIFITGELEGQPVNAVAVTGSHPAYGPGGYEIFLSDHLPSMSSVLTAQLYSLDGQELSEPYAINLPTQCEQNLILVNFQANYETKKIYMPLTFGD